MRSSFIAALVFLLLSTGAQGGRPMSPKELSEFLGPISSKKIEWTKTVGSDFDAYAGRAMAPLSGTVNIYIGGWPHFKRDAKSTKVSGRLGMFPVTWYRKTAPDGTIRQDAALKLYDLWKVDTGSSEAAVGHRWNDRHHFETAHLYRKAKAGCIAVRESQIGNFSVARNHRRVSRAVIIGAVLPGTVVGVVRKVHRWIVFFDSFNRTVKCRIEKKGAAGGVPLQPGMRSQVIDMMFADHQTNMRRASGPQYGVEQYGFALAIRDDIGVDLRGRFPLQGKIGTGSLGDRLSIR